MKKGKKTGGVFLINAPYGGEYLHFRGEPTSILYAACVLFNEIKKDRFFGLTTEHIRLYNPLQPGVVFYESIKEDFHSFRPRLVGICNLTTSSEEARKIAKLIKEDFPDVVIVFGGPHEDDMQPGIPIEKDKFKKIGNYGILKTAAYNTDVDFSIFGDGEYLFAFLAREVYKNDKDITFLKQSLLSKSSEIAQIEGYGGLCFKHQATSLPEILLCSQKKLDLNKLPLLPRDLVNPHDTMTFSMFKQGGKPVRTAQVLTYRGCPKRCTFCSECQVLNYRKLQSVLTEIKEVVDQRKYQAIFFDDSIFTVRGKSEKYFNTLMDRLRESGIEWGCQTRIDTVDKTILQKMEESGCTYIYFGVESGDNKLLDDMHKGFHSDRITETIDILTGTKIRVGLSLCFGVSVEGDTKTRETEKTIQETIDFVKELTDKCGNIILISLNLATFYPGTLMTMTSKKHFSFKKPIVHYGYPFNRFEDGQGDIAENMIKCAKFIIEYSVKILGEYLYRQDLYAIEEIINNYRESAYLKLEKETDVTDFNHASLTLPLPEVISELLKLPSKIEKSRFNYELSKARKNAAELLSIKTENTIPIGLFRNTTEAMTMAYWLSGIHQKDGKQQIIMSTAENLSLYLSYRFTSDPGNPHGRDAWSSFQDFGAMELKDRLKNIKQTIRRSDVDVVRLNAFQSKKLYYRDLIKKASHKNTSLVIISHVIRDNGRLQDIRYLISKIRKNNTEVFILIDGAQFSVITQNLEVEKLGCDFYAFAPHKTLGSYPLGVMYMSERVTGNIADKFSCPNGEDFPLVLEGMFDPKLNIKSTDGGIMLPFKEIMSFNVAVETFYRKYGLRKNFVDKIEKERTLLKKSFITKLLDVVRDFNDVEIFFPEKGEPEKEFSNFIYSFRFEGVDNRKIVDVLWRKYKVFCSYIARTNLIRFSFSPANNEKEVNKAIKAIKAIINNNDDNDNDREKLYLNTSEVENDAMVMDENKKPESQLVHS